MIHHDENGYLQISMKKVNLIKFIFELLDENL